MLWGMFTGMRTENCLVLFSAGVVGQQRLSCQACLHAHAGHVPDGLLDMYTFWKLDCLSAFADANIADCVTLGVAGAAWSAIHYPDADIRCITFGSPRVANRVLGKASPWAPPSGWSWLQPHALSAAFPHVSHSSPSCVHTLPS